MPGHRGELRPSHVCACVFLERGTKARCQAGDQGHVDGVALGDLSQRLAGGTALKVARVALQCDRRRAADLSHPLRGSFPRGGRSRFGIGPANSHAPRGVDRGGPLAKPAEDQFAPACMPLLRGSEPRDGLIELNEPRVPIGELGFTEG